jgi:hypothetical protein
MRISRIAVAAVLAVSAIITMDASASASPDEPTVTSCDFFFICC